ncbi:MAG: polyhydroxyalkanoate synthesis repressor PhaR [Alphaproteobacteria bacterium]
MAEPNDAAKPPIIIKKYANRRLYNTATSSYVTLDDLCQMVKQRIVFTVHDAKSGDDITRAVLTQIIVEEEGKGQNLLPIGFLRQLIGFYGDSLQGLVPKYLEESMGAFMHNQERMRAYVQNALGGMFPFGQFEELGKKNMAMMEQAMRMWAPMGGKGEPGDAEQAANPAGMPAPGVAREGTDKLDDLQRKIDALQRQVEDIGRTRKG